MRTKTTNTKLLWWARLIYGFVALNTFVGAMIVIYVFQERRGANWTVNVPVRPFTRHVAVISGTTVVSMAVMIILWPETAVANWTWQTSPLMVRIFAAWFGAFGVGLLWFKFEHDWQRLSQIPNLMIAAAGLDLLMVFVHRQTVIVDLNFWLYCGHLILFALIGELLHWSQSRTPFINDQISTYEL